MKNTIIIYKSKYGSTKQYAQWIAKETSSDIASVEDADKMDLSTYKKIVFGTYVHIGSFVDINFLLKNWSRFEKKRVILFTTSAAKPDNPELISQYNANVPQTIRDKIKYFRLRGRVSNLDFADNLKVSIPRTMLKIQYFFSKEEKTKRLIEGFSPFDGMDKKSIAPIVKEIKKK
jgi:flavodoxin